MLSLSGDSKFDVIEAVNSASFVERRRGSTKKAPAYSLYKTGSHQILTLTHRD